MALVSHTRNVIYLEDGEFAEVSADAVRVFDSLGAAVEKKVTRVLCDVQAASGGSRRPVGGDRTVRRR